MMVIRYDLCQRSGMSTLCLKVLYLFGRLHVRENSRGKVCIAGLMETEVTSVKGLVEVRACF